MAIDAPKLLSNGLLQEICVALGAAKPPPTGWLQQVLETEYVAAAGAVLKTEHPDAEPLRSLALLRAAERIETPSCQTFKTQLAQHYANEAAQPLRRLDMRVDWLLGVTKPTQQATLSPSDECDRVYHQVAKDFRAELRIFAVLHELRAAVALPLASFFLSTGEFSERGAKRIVDTVLLVTNILEWGAESQRGAECLRRIQAIHERYQIPNDAMKYVLLGIAFVPLDFNQHLGWRPLSSEEKHGWVQAFVQLGKNMGVEALDAPHEQLRLWYRDYSQRHAFYSPKKRQLVESVVVQVLDHYPLTLRPTILAALIAGMDEVYLRATRFPQVPKTLSAALKRLFAVVGKRLAKTQSGPWLQSLQLSSVYPSGYTIDQLGPPQKSKYFPETSLRQWSWRELREGAATGRLLTAVDGDVLDLTEFAATHPGGAEILNLHAGVDASDAFVSACHGAEVNTLKLNYRVGRLDASRPAQPLGEERRLPRQVAKNKGRTEPEQALRQPRSVEAWANEVAELLRKTKSGSQLTTQEINQSLNQLINETQA